MQVPSTAYATERSIREIQRQREAINRTQDQVASGVRLTAPSEDPVAAASAERARSRLARVEVEQRVLGFAKSKIATAESTLGDAGGLLQTARDTLVAAGNGSLGTSDLRSLADQLQSTRDMLFALGNRGDADGGYVFGGKSLAAGTPPFSEATNTATPAIPAKLVSYEAQAGERQVGGQLVLSTTVDGAATFLAQPRPGGGTQNIFEVLDRAVAALRGESGVPVADAVSTGLQGVDVGIDAVLAQRTRMGEQLRAIDTQEASLALDGENTTTLLSSLTDTDLAEALSRLSVQQAAFSAGLQSYAQISKMSLFQYL